MIKILFMVLVIAISTMAHAMEPDSGHGSTENNFIGRKACAACHVKQSVQWLGSHHERAMQNATMDTVLGDFNNVQFSHHDVTSTFFIKDGGFWVNTDGPQGKLQDFKIAYTFGVYPLQQYLIAMPGGRLQVLDIAWDTRSSEQGGQRWYALHAEKSAADDVLHWTGPNLNWNFMCADCHSTNLQKNYNAQTQSYDTQWSEINVACEACHGPGLEHQQWALAAAAETGSDAAASYKNKGLKIIFNERKEVLWQHNADNDQPVRSLPRASETEIETCARCHSRRSQLAHPQTGERFMDHYRPALLTSGLYYADGQIQDEVYVYGSFLQSKMYQAGVTCSDCHDPHIAGLKLPGDRVCNQCHQPEQYRTIKHHHHPGSADTTCLDCHMPQQTYMGVDQRRDHSFRIPRPDISAVLKTPDVCSRCHADKSPQWAAQQLADWYGDKKSGFQQFAPILDAQRKQLDRTNQKALELLLDNNQPAIARATVMSQLTAHIDKATLTVIARQLQLDNSMLRVAALMALGSWSETNSLEFEAIAQLAFPHLDDPVRLVRLEAARILAPMDETQLQPEQQRRLQTARQEYIDSLLFNAERPESQLSLGNFYRSMNHYEKAEKAYRQALTLQPQFVPAWVNLAQFYSTMNREPDALQTLEQGIARVPEADSADLYHAKGLSQVRLKQSLKALETLAKAAQLAPDNSHYSYVYAIALNSLNKSQQALTFLEQSHQRLPQSFEILSLLVSINQDNGNHETALKYAEQLLALEPDNVQIQGLIQQLKRQLQ